MAFEMARRAYVELNGPTVGDGIRLADTNLIARVEKDYLTPGEEVSFGGGKVIRDGMGQDGRSVSSLPARQSLTTPASTRLISALKTARFSRLAKPATQILKIMLTSGWVCPPRSSAAQD